MTKRELFREIDDVFVPATDKGEQIALLELKLGLHTYAYYLPDYLVNLKMRVKMLEGIIKDNKEMYAK